jgi:hypothetical protein
MSDEGEGLPPWQHANGPIRSRRFGAVQHIEVLVAADADDPVDAETQYHRGTPPADEPGATSVPMFGDIDELVGTNADDILLALRWNARAASLEADEIADINIVSDLIQLTVPTAELGEYAYNELCKHYDATPVDQSEYEIVDFFR